MNNSWIENTHTQIYPTITGPNGVTKQTDEREIAHHKIIIQRKGGRKKGRQEGKLVNVHNLS